jgi:hypothetical protein
MCYYEVVALRTTKIRVKRRRYEFSKFSELILYQKSKF